MDVFNFFKDKKVVEEFQRSQWRYLIDIEKQVNQTKYGQISVVLRVHQGKVTDLIVQESRRMRYDLEKKA